MHYFWFVPVFAVVGILTVIFYFVVTRGLPKISNRSVEDALAQEREEDEKTKTD